MTEHTHACTHTHTNTHVLLHSIQSMRGPWLASCNLFQLLGLVNGATEEKDIREELLKQKEQKQEQGEDYEDVNTDQESVDEEGD